ncbi:MBL fold metallo-hydrolase [Flavobacterium agricola]|uniref:MBL fold metallo-hydrolase n=1 Tax=Flavobacterium agricola TaxID=2870839 RepID=A0ABY6M4S2_9FLAO|nr:MBL fold metallo-hydrolase [Flavobacterium agricola]UYW02436.1 MBL fold metallo-hydrolase [Flavobacterium agricola]
MKIYFLGTGTSQGIPVIGSDHPVCLSPNFKDKRLRTSILIKQNNTALAIDCGPDFRQQMLQANCQKLDAILFTHEHADHTAGLDDIRPFNFKQGPMPIYVEPRVLSNLQNRFDYVFETENRYPGAPAVQTHLIHENETFEINTIKIEPIRVLHGTLPIFGFKIDNFAYLTDVKFVSDAEQQKLQNLDVLVINALRTTPHQTHFNLDEALQFIKQIKPKKAYITHISHLLGFHDEVQASLPKHVFLAYDNLEINI